MWKHVTRWVIGALALGGCQASFPSVTAPAPEASSGRGVSACVLYQERAQRPAWQGVRGGEGTWDYAIASVLLRRPTGLVMIDPAFGVGVADDLARAGPLVQLALGTARTKRPLVDVMAEAGIDPGDIDYALVTHAHWDHTGALVDLPRATVLMAERELEWVQPFTRFVEAGVMTHHLKRVKSRLRAFPWNGPPVEGFEASFDVFGDGSVVAVPLPGHTPGSAGYFVRGVDGQRWLFIGDAAWTSRGVDGPAHKTMPMDEDAEALSRTLARLHALARARGETLVVVPAHDAEALSKLPTCGVDAR